MAKASDCGSEDRGFESHYPPHKNEASKRMPHFLCFGKSLPRLHGLAALSLKHFCISGVDSSSNPWYHTPNTKTQGRGKSSFIPECREPSAGARRGRKNCILASERLFRTQCQVGQTEPDRYSGRRLPGRCQEAALRQKEWYRKVFTKALSLYHRRQGVFLHKQYRKGKNYGNH